MIPGVKGPPPSREEARAFHEWDANCNTCRHLKRVPCRPTFGGPHDGICLRTSAPITFHPDDWMGMPCWEARPISPPRKDAGEMSVKTRIAMDTVCMAARRPGQRIIVMTPRPGDAWAARRWIEGRFGGARPFNVAVQSLDDLNALRQSTPAGAGQIPGGPPAVRIFHDDVDE